MFFTYHGKGRQWCCSSLACNGVELDASVSVLGSANTFISELWKADDCLHLQTVLL